MPAVLQDDGLWRYALRDGRVQLTEGYGESQEEARLMAQRRWLFAHHTPTVAEVERSAEVQACQAS